MLVTYKARAIARLLNEQLPQDVLCHFENPATCDCPEPDNPNVPCLAVCDGKCVEACPPISRSNPQRRPFNPWCQCVCPSGLAENPWTGECEGCFPACAEDEVCEENRCRPYMPGIDPPRPGHIAAGFSQQQQSAFITLNNPVNLVEIE